MPIVRHGPNAGGTVPTVDATGGRNALAPGHKRNAPLPLFTRIALHHIMSDYATACRGQLVECILDILHSGV